MEDLSFERFEIVVRKAFGKLIPSGARYVWRDPNRKGGMRYCASTTNGLFITGNPKSKTISVYKDPKDRYPTVIPV